jgi:hypothetical protein
VNAAIDAGHSPEDVWQWAEGDLLHYANYVSHK